MIVLQAYQAVLSGDSFEGWRERHAEFLRQELLREQVERVLETEDITA
jgi:hypothetical protein